MKSLRFYLSGQSQHTNRMLELLLHRATQIAFVSDANPTEPIVCNSTLLTPVGYELEEGLLPYPDRSFPGYRLLSEFFAFPRKFHFVDLKLPDGWNATTRQKLDIYIYLDRASSELETIVNEEMFRLSCTPIVNLFPLRCEPIRYTQYESEYRVICDLRRPLAHEIFSIDQVIATTPDGQEREIKPLYSAKHIANTDEHYWQQTRRNVEQTPGMAVDRGTEVYLQLSDSTIQHQLPPDSIIHVYATCLNRDLPAQLPYGGGQPKLKLTSGGLAIGNITALTPPSQTLRPNLGPDTLWKLISHLHLNHLSLVDGVWGAASLRSILSLYDLYDRAETRAMIDGIVNIQSRRVTGRVGAGIARGIEVELTLDEDRFTNGAMFAFASVLERFIGMYASINSFTRLVARTKTLDGIYRKWPGRSGSRVLA